MTDKEFRAKVIEMWGEIFPALDDALYGDKLARASYGTRKDYQEGIVTEKGFKKFNDFIKENQKC